MAERLNPKVIVSTLLLTGSCMFVSSLAAIDAGRNINQSALLYFASRKNRTESVLQDNTGHEFVTSSNRFLNHTSPLMIGTREGVMFGLIKMDNPGCMISLDIVLPPGINRQISLNSEQLDHALDFILAKHPESC